MEMDEEKAILTRIPRQPFPVNKKQLDKAEYFKYFGSLRQMMQKSNQGLPCNKQHPTR
jgi:hypothetical protein